MYSLRVWGVSNSTLKDFGVFWEYRVPSRGRVPSVWSRSVPSGTHLLTVDLQKTIMTSTLTAAALDQRDASNVSRPDVMRKSAVVKRMKPWPRRELCALTRGDLRPRRWRWWLGDWVLGHIFCCLQSGLMGSPSEGRVRSVCADTAQHMGFVRPARLDRYLHTRHGFGRTPLTLCPSWIDFLRATENDWEQQWVT